MRSLGTVARGGVIALVVAAVHAAPTPVLAECNPPGADPSVRPALQAAKRILVGTVVAVEDDDPGGVYPPDTSYRFTLDVDRVLRGSATRTLEVDRLETDACLAWIPARLGDRIVLALDTGRANGMATNTAGWLAGRPPEGAPFDVITLDEVESIVGAPTPPAPPATSTAPAASPPAALDPGVLVGVFVLGLVAGWRRLSPRGRSGETPPG